MPVNSRPITDRPGIRVQQTGTRRIAEPSSRTVAAPLMKSAPKCACMKADGTRCGAAPIKGVGICVGHMRKQEADRADTE